MKQLSIIALMLAGLTACATVEVIEWEATGGSRADSVIELSYQYNPRVTEPVLDDDKALTLATERCQAWGYTSAEAFGGEVSSCVQEGGTGSGCYFPARGYYYSACAPSYTTCRSLLVTKKYQCLGDPKPAD